MKLISKLRSFLFGASTQKYWVVTSFILAIVGQSIIREPQPFSSFQPLTETLTGWNHKFHLLLKNPVNITLGLLLIIFSVFIYSRLFPQHNTSQNTQTLVIEDKNWSSWKKFLPWGIVNLGIYILVMIQLARHQYSSILLSSWLASILIFTILFWKNEQKIQLNPDSSITGLDVIWMLTLFAFAIASGSYLLNDLPAGWVPDEGGFWIVARSIALGEKNPPFFDFGVYSFPVSSSILQGWIMRWAGVDMWGWRFASVLPAALTVIPLYLLTRELFDRRTAIAANIMMIANPYFLAFSRLGYNNSQALFPTTLCIYFLILGFRRNSRFYLWLAGLSAGLGFYTYFAAWLGLVVLVITVMSFPLIHKGKIQRSIIPLAIIISGMLIASLPRVLYGTSSNSPFLLHAKIWETVPMNALYGQSIFGEDRIAQASLFRVDNQVDLFYDPSLYGIVLLRGFVLSIAFLFDPVKNYDHHIIFGITGPGSSIFFVLGLGRIFSNIKKIRNFIPSIWFLAGFFLLGVLTSFPPRPTHLVAIIPVLSIISAVGLVSFLDALLNINSSNPEKARSRKNGAIGSILLLIAMIGFFQYFFMTLYIYCPPNTDDYISWLGRQIPKPANMFLVDINSERNPNEEGLFKLSPHHISYLTRSNLEGNPSQMDTWKNFVTFVNDKELGDWIAGKIPTSTVQAAYVPGQRLRGYVVTDMQVNASMDISLSHGLRDLWNSPTRNILLLCGIGIAALLVKQKRAEGQTPNKMNETP
jgi:4-amino-4-deoxy-L-arabinose transferase-like glycosyltransferase